MIASDNWPLALFGGPLLGDRAVRFVFMDEAGTSADEPWAVVVGIVADADEHIVLAERSLLEALGAVPKEHREGFYFHAKEIFGSNKWQDDWILTSRLNLLKEIMAIPRNIGMAVSISAIKRDADSPILPEIALSAKEQDHFLAFKQCVAVADRYIREHCGPREVGTVLAENHPTMQRHLSSVVYQLRHSPVHFPKKAIIPSEKETEQGYIEQDGVYRVTRIRNAIYWSDKWGEPLLQIADACAYGIRRYLAQQKFGDEFMRAIVGGAQPLPHEPFSMPGWASCLAWPKP
jgi:hypothetical protein